MDNPLIGAKIVEASGHTSSEINWQEVKKIGRDKFTSGYRNMPRKDVWHFTSLTLEMPDGTTATLEASSYCDAAFMELD